MFYLSFFFFSRLHARTIHQQVPLTKEDWKTVLLWSSPILLVDEILKCVGRRLQAKEKSQAALQQNQAVTTSF